MSTRWDIFCYLLPSVNQQQRSSHKIWQPLKLKKSVQYSIYYFHNSLILGLHTQIIIHHNQAASAVYATLLTEIVVFVIQKHTSLKVWCVVIKFHIIHIPVWANHITLALNVCKYICENNILYMHLTHDQSLHTWSCERSTRKFKTQ